MSSPRMPCAPAGLVARWKPILFVVFGIYAAILAWHAYQRVGEVDLSARARLIQEHRLWELQPDFHGNTQSWTRLAARLLNDSQLIERITVRYGALAPPIELDYRRDLAVARAEVVVTAIFAFAVPLCIPCGIILLWRRRPAAPPLRRTAPASVDDPRYKPPPDAD